MRRKNILRNVTLITILVVSVFILSAQVSQSGNKGNQHSVADSDGTTQQAEDTVPTPDNTVGLSELDQIIKRYENRSLYLSGDINFYANADSMSTPQESTTFVSIITQAGSAYEMDSVLTIAKEDITVWVDRKEKSIAVSETDPELKELSGKRNIAEELSMFKDYIFSIVPEVVSENEKRLVIEFKEDAPVTAASYVIIYEPKTYKIKKVRMEMPDGEITENKDGQESDEDELIIVDSANNEIPTGYYANIKMSVYEIVYKIEKTADASLVDVNRYIRKTAEGYILADSFKSYELIN